MTESKRPVYCGACGSLASSEDKFCGTCGSIIPPDAQAATPTEEIPTLVSEPQGIRPGRGDKRPLVLIGGVMAILTLVGVGMVVAVASARETIEPLPGVRSKIPNGWTISAESAESGRIPNDSAAVYLVPEENRDLKEPTDAEATIGLRKGASGCDYKPAEVKSSPVPSIANGYDDFVTGDGSMVSSQATVAGREAKWNLSYSSFASPWSLPGDSSASDYPNYDGSTSLTVCPEDTNLVVDYYVGSELVEGPEEDPDTPPTRQHNASVPEARQEVHNDLHQSYEAHIGALTQFLEDLETDEGDSTTDLAGLPTSLDGIDQKLSDPFKGQLKDTSKSGTTKPPSTQPDSGKPGTTTPTTPSSQPGSDEERLKKFGREYDTANRRGDWKKTYSMLDEGSQKEFTEKEWAEKHQALRDASGTPAPLESVTVEFEEGVADAPGTVTLNYEDGTEEAMTVPTMVVATKQTNDKGPKRSLTEEEISDLKQVSTDDTGNRDEAGAEEAAGDYYRAAGSQDWDYTYNNLDSTTKSRFSREEWRKKNQWFMDNSPAIYHIESVELGSTSQRPLAEVEVRLTGEDGSSSIRNTYFVFEDGKWKHRFAQEEIDLFEPGVSFEEWVDVQ